jgi:hypothetical protein
VSFAVATRVVLNVPFVPDSHHFELFFAGREPAMDAGNQGGVDDEVGARCAPDRLHGAGAEPERHRAALGFGALENPHPAD